MADNLQVSAKISEEKSVNILTLSVVRRDGAPSRRTTLNVKIFTLFSSEIFADTCRLSAI